MTVKWPQDHLCLHPWGPGVRVLSAGPICTVGVVKGSSDIGVIQEEVGQGLSLVLIRRTAPCR